MNKRHAILAIGLALAGWLALFGDKTPAIDIAEPVSRTLARPTPAETRMASPIKAVATTPEDEQTILALQPRDTLISATLEKQRPSGLFNSHSWAPPPPPAPKPPPPPPPMAPPLPFTYIGKKLDGDTWEVYLARGEQAFIVATHSVIEGTYRVESIRPPQLTLTYLPLNQQQILTIGGTD